MKLHVKICALLLSKIPTLESVHLDTGCSIFKIYCIPGLHWLTKLSSNSDLLQKIKTTFFYYKVLQEVL